MPSREPRAAQLEMGPSEVRGTSGGFRLGRVRAWTAEPLENVRLTGLVIFLKAGPGGQSRSSAGLEGHTGARASLRAWGQAGCGLENSPEASGQVSGRMEVPVHQDHTYKFVH